MRISLWLTALALATSLTALAVQAPADRDGDGITDANEEVLGTDPSVPDRLQVVLTDGVEPAEQRKQKRYDATKDFVKIECGHVGDDRFLWRATFATAPRLEDTVFHLYVDADADAKTGRKTSPGSAMEGTEYMVSVSSGRGWSNAFLPDGSRAPTPLVSFAVQGNTLLMTADVKVGRDAKGIRYGLFVLCHSSAKGGHSPHMSDTAGKTLITGIPVSGRKKITRPCDHTENFGVDATFGLDTVRGVLRAKDTVAVRHDKLTLDGFEVDQLTSRRWPHLKRTARKAVAWTRPPKPGTYHVGFMMYDDSRDDRVAFAIDGVFCGIAIANQNNNRVWLYWLKEARTFTGRERVELQAVGQDGRHRIINMLFLPTPPKPRTIAYRVENMAAVSHVDNPRRVTLSWTTTWPCPTRFEYGATTAYGTRSEAEGSCLVHRVVLDGLDPKTTYHGRAIGTTREGKPFVGADYVFRARPPVPPPTRAGTHTVPLAVRNPHPFAATAWPVTTGIPFPKGELGSIDHVRLMGNTGEVPVQVRLTARWPDGSVKWLLATFLADAPAGGGQAAYHLEYGPAVRRAPAPKGLSATKTAAGVALDTGALRLLIGPNGEIANVERGGQRLLAKGAACGSLATDAAGKTYSTAPSKAQLIIEEAGPIRAVVKVVSHLDDGKGATLFRIEKRIEAYRGASFVRVHHTFVVTRPDTFTDIKDLSYRIPVQAEGRTWGVALADGTTLPLGASDATVQQRFDNEFVTIGRGSERASKGRIVGSAVAGGADGCAVAVRDFWQNYPKAIRVRPDGLHVALCPAFEKGLYDKFPFEKEGHHLYYYLLGGVTKLKRGVSKTHELLLSFAPDAIGREQAATLFQRPLLATAPPTWYCGSRAFYDVAPRDTKRFPLYEEAIDKNLVAYEAQRERWHDYGMLNYGDWYPERRANWGNIEYDTQHAFFLEYIRSGNPAAFFLGCSTEIHNRDIDTVQWSTNPKSVGAVYIHQMGHVGGYYTKSVPGTLGFPSAGYTVSHAWTEGHFEHAFLTGDRRSYETGRAVADYFLRKNLGRPYDFTTTRVPGWHLIMLAAAYHATGDPYYLNAAKVIVERVLDTQDKLPRPLPKYQCAGRKPYQVGGWSRMMRPGHCRCIPRHRGNANFMIAVLLSGLKYYHDVTGDPRVKQAIIAGAHYLLDECYSEETKGFRYTSCPKTRYGHGASPLMVEGIARAYVWTKDKRFRRVLTESLPLGAKGRPYGKSFSMYYRMAPRLLADLAAAGITLDKKPE